MGIKVKAAAVTRVKPVLCQHHRFIAEAGRYAGIILQGLQQRGQLARAAQVIFRTNARKLRSPAV